MLRVGQIGIGGFGGSHLRAQEILQKEGKAKLVAIAETNQVKWRERVDECITRGARVYTDWREMLAAEDLDIVGIATPLHLHRDMVIASLESGRPTMCEKSAATTVQDVAAMAAAVERTGRMCAIDFQWLSSTAINKMQQIIADGTLGQVRSIYGTGLGIRKDSYYQRSPWAGKFKMNDLYVLDGPMDNAFAHSLNNMLYLAAPQKGKLAHPIRVRAEMYRAQPLPEMEDTAAVQVQTAEGVEIFFFTTYNAEVASPHYYRIEGSKGTAVLDDGVLTLNTDGQSTVVLESAFDGNTTLMYRNFLAALKGEDVPYSAVAESIQLCRAQNGAYKSSGRIHPIAPAYFRRYQEENDWGTVVPGIDEVMRLCAEQGKLPSDVGAPWAVPTSWVDVADMNIYTPASPDDMR